MRSPAERSTRIARKQADAKARRIRADLAYRKRTDPEVYDNLAEHYQQDGYGLDGYPLDYTGPKTLD